MEREQRARFFERPGVSRWLLHAPGVAMAASFLRTSEEPPELAAAIRPYAAACQPLPCLDASETGDVLLHACLVGEDARPPPSAAGAAVGAVGPAVRGNPASAPAARHRAIPHATGSAHEGISPAGAAVAPANAAADSGAPQASAAHTHDGLETSHVLLTSSDFGRDAPVDVAVDAAVGGAALSVLGVGQTQKRNEDVDAAVADGRRHGESCTSLVKRTIAIVDEHIISQF